jgi:hypothetical protein
VGTSDSVERRSDSSLQNQNSLLAGSNDKLERPRAALQQAPGAHNRFALAAQSDQVSRPLQALVRSRPSSTKENKHNHAVGELTQSETCDERQIV